MEGIGVVYYVKPVTLIKCDNALVGRQPCVWSLQRARHRLDRLENWTGGSLELRASFPFFAPPKLSR